MENEPTQYTPEGYEIPVPTHDEVEDALQRMAQPARPEPEPEPKPSRRSRRRSKE